MSNDDNQVQIPIFCPLNFGYQYQKVSGYFIPIIPKNEHTEDQIWFDGILDKSTGRVILATIGRTTFSHKMTS